MDFTANSLIQLNDGQNLPRLGFGVYQSPPGQDTVFAVSEALRAGYRLIDTAAIYGNEADVGRAVRECGIERSGIKVTTKLWNTEQGYDSALRAFDRSLKTLGLDQVDLYLIHWPVEKKRLDSWKALIEIKKSGRAKSIGVSNFTIRHLQELLDHSGFAPAINQVEWSPFLYQAELLQFCKQHQIVLEAYSPLTRGERLTDPTIKGLALKYKKTPAQILVRWCMEHGVIPLPKSNTLSRIRENAAVFDFEIDAADVISLDSLNEDFRTSWDPSRVI
jgi:diketogulonate reductase-like aldo/keto reductase